MDRLRTSARFTILLITLALALVAQTDAIAASQTVPTSIPQPTTAGNVNENTSPSLFFLITGACIIGAGGIAIFLRYKA